ncbi:hypothetical protein NDU88_000565 [Pleurodeles waltl]|uniref:Reverse transcriptase domain-containing protein n=1 Tax=Pleurodeles waltl TaxID=8319 RepID=A0AAV7THM1_PLEWA|nr:hypothetical protein NDU88_000565 [Pleurodeles waltl]
MLRVAHAHESTYGAVDLVAEFSQLFDGTGCLKNCLIFLHIEDSIQPVALRHCRVAFHLCPKVEEELRKLEPPDIIEWVDSPKPGVSPIVVALKPKQPGEHRICVDMFLPNLAFRCELHLTPIADDIVTKLSGSRWFSKVGLQAGYHQLMLDPELRVMTFSTHVGLKKVQMPQFWGA